MMTDQSASPIPRCWQLAWKVLAKMLCSLAVKSSLKWAVGIVISSCLKLSASCSPIAGAVSKHSVLGAVESVEFSELFIDVFAICHAQVTGPLQSFVIEFALVVSIVKQPIAIFIDHGMKA